MDPRHEAIQRVLEATQDRARNPRVQPLVEEASRGLVPSHARFVREVCLGVYRNRLLLDHVALSLSKSGKPPPRAGGAALRSGLYQLLFLHRLPPFAVVDGTVEACASSGGRHMAGFVNACLRRVVAAMETLPAAQATPRMTDWARDVWVERDGMVVHLRWDKPLLTDPQRNPVPYLSVRWSHPRVLVERWLARHPRDVVERVLRAGTLPPAVHLRANPLRGDRDALAARLLEEGVETDPDAHPLFLRVRGASAPVRTRAFEGGFFSIQDPSAMQVVELLDPRPGQRVLDLCAAPGGKTTAVAERIGDRGDVVAFDADAARLATVTDNRLRLGLAAVRVVESEVALQAELSRRFDRILVDVPCSNTGVLARRVEARWRWSAEHLQSLNTTQEALLRRALGALVPGGQAVYATCSLEPEENEALVERVLADTPGCRRGPAESFLPDPPHHDGGFAVVLIKD